LAITMDHRNTFALHGNSLDTLQFYVTMIGYGMCLFQLI
jgi:hypothetical protein